MKCQKILLKQNNKKYKPKNGISCEYKQFCFVATGNDEILGAISGYTCFSEIYIDELVVSEKHRSKDIGSKLIKTVEDYFKDSDFNNINTCTNEFQAPKFYEKYGFTLEFVRKNNVNHKLNKCFYVKYLNNN